MKVYKDVLRHSRIKVLWYIFKAKVIQTVKQILTKFSTKDTILHGILKTVIGEFSWFPVLVWVRQSIDHTIFGGFIEEILRLRLRKSAAYFRYDTMVENRKKHRQNSHLINHCPTSERVSEWASQWAQRRARAKRAVLSKRTSERCKWTKERTGPVLQSVFFVILAHSVWMIFEDLKWSLVEICPVFVVWLAYVHCLSRRRYISRMFSLTWSWASWEWDFSWLLPQILLCSEIHCRPCPFP